MIRALALMLMGTAIGLARAKDPARVWMSGTPEAAAAALAAGADPNAMDPLGQRPLAVAARHNPRIAPLLLKAGADPRGKGEFGRTALMAAASDPSASPATLDLLLRAGADLDAQDTLEGRTALMEAAVSQSPGALQALLRAGARLDLRDKRGRTALELAAEQDMKDPGMVLTLLGASLGTRERPLDLALPSAASLRGAWVGGGYYAIQVLDLFVEKGRVEAGVFVKVRPNMGTSGTLRGYGITYQRVPAVWEDGALQLRYDLEVENVLVQERGTFYKVPVWFQLRPSAAGTLEGIHVWGDHAPVAVTYRKAAEDPSGVK